MDKMSIKTLNMAKNDKNHLEKGQKGTERDKKGHKTPKNLVNYENFHVPFLSLFYEILKRDKIFFAFLHLKY